MININFDSLSLKIDYLSFNFQFNNLEQIQVIADFLETKLSCKNQTIRYKLHYTAIQYNE